MIRTSHDLWICPHRSSSYLRPHQRRSQWSGPDSAHSSARWCHGSLEPCSQTSASDSDEHMSEITERGSVVVCATITDKASAQLKVTGNNSAGAQLYSPQSFPQDLGSAPSPPSTDSPCSQYVRPLSKCSNTRQGFEQCCSFFCCLFHWWWYTLYFFFFLNMHLRPNWKWGVVVFWSISVTESKKLKLTQYWNNLSESYILTFIIKLDALTTTGLSDFTFIKSSCDLGFLVS